MVATVITSDATDEAIMGTLIVHLLVKVIHIMAAPCTVAEVIFSRTIATPKIVDAIFFAVSVLTAPIPHRVTFQERPYVYRLP